MTHLDAFDGLVGFVTLHPLFTLGPVAAAGVWAGLALRRKQSSGPQAARPRR